MPPDKNNFDELKNELYASVEQKLNNGGKTNSNEQFKYYTLNRLDKIVEDISTIKSEVSGLKVKSGIWGAIAGLIPVATLIIIYFLFN